MLFLVIAEIRCVVITKFAIFSTKFVIHQRVRHHFVVAAFARIKAMKHFIVFFHMFC